ncbi:aminotransferase class III-fold pyridoxal phosphate-dependent enzyme [Geminicoccaceae bacterium 1502E]|nr:aminotransferase class III-fold pyridoxal phosphate-dependent enzyme [Geminicoccaceae bacterium 1502E]
MLVRNTDGNYRNDNLLLGFSDLRRLRSERPLVFAKGRGIFVIDENGKDYIEAVSSFYCAALGFSDEELADAAMRQLRALPMYPSAIHRTTTPVMELSERLAAIAPVRNARVHFAVTGSEANDHLLKFMWYGNGFTGEPQRRKLVSRRASYHGSTIATAALGGGRDLHDSFALPMQDYLVISHPSWPEAAEPGEDEAAFTDRLAAELEQVIEEAGPETVGGLIAEPVSVSSGMYPPPAGYFEKITAVLRRYGIRLFVDEVVTGFGRSGEMWASQAMGLEPDCVTCAKGISGAYMPIAALLLGEEFAERLDRGSDAKGWFAHGATHAAHTVSAAVALKVLDIFDERDVLGHVRRIIPRWNAALDGLLDHPLVIGNRKFGLMGALKVADPREAPDGNAAASLQVGGIAKAIYEAGLDAGIIVRPLAGCLVMAPPLIITETEIDELARRLRLALDRTLAALPAA